jgi:hypothetical protein
VSVEPARLADVYGAPVYVGEARVGVVAEVFADADRLRVVGLGISLPDGSSRFLPWAAARLEERAVRSTTPLAFLAAHELEYYAAHASRLDADDPAGAAMYPDGVLVAARDDPPDGVLTAAGEGTPTG